MCLYYLIKYAYMEDCCQKTYIANYIYIFIYIYVNFEKGSERFRV